MHADGAVVDGSGGGTVINTDDRVTLYRPVGQAELDKVRDTGWRAFPPRLTWQLIFYPVLNEQYAIRIARDWNTEDPASGFVGYVLRFSLPREYVERFEPHVVGDTECVELWVPAGELDELNSRIVGKIELIHAFERPP